NLELPVKRLPFLGPSKRQALGLLELEKAENPSVSFIRLYAGLGRNEKTSYSCPVFSFAEDSFSGFAIAHSFLRPVACDPSLDSGDFIFAERDCLLSDGEEKGFAFSREMKDEAMRWLGENSPLPEEDNQAVLRDKILSLMAEKRAKSSDSRICISQSDLRDFFPCQSHWLFNRLLRLDEDNLTGDLTGSFDMGNINHKLLESFMNWRMTSKGRLPITAADGTFGDEEDEICEKLRLLAEDSIEDYSMDFRDSIISKLAFHRQKDAIVHGVLDCLHSMCRPEEEKKLSFGGWGIFAAEKILFAESGEGKWLYEGKLDCILKNDLGCLAILDYKSGMTPTIASCIAGDDGILRDYQMPMYVTLCEESGKVGDISAAAFFSIKASSATIVVQPMEKKGRSKSVDREAFEPSMDAFRNYSRVFYEKVSSCDMTPRSGSEDIYNSVDAYSDCQGCRFKTVCRTAFRVCGRKLGAALWRK
ncbi:MAG: PD-(D/E)XK nuclease family protein, partial [Treponema sp.]|nr:PD-(D/E)XK nuclease family protein [Treponema sp.]